jgi:hypothetical protein
MPSLSRLDVYECAETRCPVRLATEASRQDTHGSDRAGQQPDVGNPRDPCRLHKTGRDQQVLKRDPSGSPDYGTGSAGNPSVSPIRKMGQKCTRSIHIAMMCDNSAFPRLYNRENLPFTCPREMPPGENANSMCPIRTATSCRLPSSSDDWKKLCVQRRAFRSVTRPGLLRCG